MQIYTLLSKNNNFYVFFVLRVFLGLMIYLFGLIVILVCSDCHPERSEGSSSLKMLHFVQHDSGWLSFRLVWGRM